MNLRSYPGDYNIGLDMGTGSVGWAVTDAKGQLLHFNKKPTWGSRLFDGALPASDARVHRGQRRRYIRRRWRLNLLQKLFENEMAKVDPDFFMRLNQSREIEGDPIFNGNDFTKADYYDRFKTIYHLRVHLMETDEQADLRLIYLAMHNIVKHRGNFLRQDDKGLSAKNAKADDAVNAFFSALDAWCDACGYERKEEHSAEVKAIANALAQTDRQRKEIQEQIVPHIAVPLEEASAAKKFSKAIAAAMLGLSAEFRDIFGEFECEKTKISLGKEEDLEALREACPDECKDLLESLYGVYSTYVLQGILSDPSHAADGKTISYYMISKYEKYGQDLDALQALVKAYAPANYDDFFRGPTYHDSNKGDPSRDYDVSKAQGYTKYNLGKTSYDDFKKEIEKLFGSTAAANDERYQKMLEEFDRQQFLRRLKTSDNGSICYQLHYEELAAIIDNQARFYPFLKDEKEKLLSLVSFRIPYYVGPLTSKNAAKDKHGNNRFQWSERKPGMEDAVITPWNWESVIDKNKSAENFIMRMTGDCTYLAGEKVLPKCSLLYEEFCVLNELNGIRYSDDGDDEHRLDAAQREGIVRDLFHNTRSVSYKKIADWLVRKNDAIHPVVKGGQGANGLESKMSSYIFFKKDVFGVDHLSPSDYPMIEKIILWNTLFEDRAILKEKLEDEFGERGNGMLDAKQIKTICKKRFTGWGRLSKEFLTGVKAIAQDGRKVSFMDVLREGNPNSTRRRGETMVLMQVLHDEDLGFDKLIEKRNAAYFAQHKKDIGVNELPGSPAIRRSLNQAIRIVDEIASIAGRAPANIFIEVTRDEDKNKKGKRTKRRKAQIEEALVAFKKEDPQLWNEWKEKSKGDLDERLTLYFMQRGKCLYSGRAIDINQLSNTGLYEVDHIIPRSYRPDDSLENKALVYREENQRKTDELLLDPDVRRNMATTWQALHEAGLIGEKKFNNLMRSHISDETLKGFINRQLVETSQSIKLTQSLLSVRYPQTEILPVKAMMSHGLREDAGVNDEHDGKAIMFIKSREANNFHHAHDAFLACRVGLYIKLRYPDIYENPVRYMYAVREFIKHELDEFKKTKEMPGSSGFVIGSFCHSVFLNRETGEVLWDPKAELKSISRTLNCRQCHVCRMPQEDAGAFWNATIYSPRDPKMGPKLALPIKQMLDVRVYGGYSSQQFAYFFIYEAKKNGKRCYRFAEVPVWLANSIECDSSLLDKYAAWLAKSEQLEFVQITRRKLLKKQLIEIDGERFFITGKKAMANASEIAFSTDECAALERYVRKNSGKRYEKISSTVDSFQLLEHIERTGALIAKRLLNLIKMDDLASAATKLTEDERFEIVIRILSLVNGAAGMADLRAAGGSKFAGYLQPNYSKLLSDPNIDFYIIDQSVTGMFERKTRVGL